MTKPEPSSATAAACRPRLGVGAVLDRSLRLAIMLVILAVGSMLLHTFWSLRHPSSAASAEQRAKASASALQGSEGVRAQTILDPLSLQQGAWSLGDSSWMVSLVDLSDAASQARLRSLGSRASGKAKSSALEQHMLLWLRRYRPARVEDCRVYDVPLGAARARVVTRVEAGGERLRLVQLTYSRGRSLQLLEASPAPDAGAERPAGSHLLPLPDGVVSLARRWDDSQRLACEILGPASLLECLSAWSSAGWTSAKIAAKGSSSLVLLRQGERIIQLCPLETEGTGSPAYLLLTAQPTEQ